MEQEPQQKQIEEYPPEPEGPLYLTPALLTLQVAAYLFLGLRGRNFLQFDDALLLASGASQGIAIFEGEVWRLFSALFIPSSPEQTALVLGGLYLFTPMLERQLGVLRTLAIYLICGWAGLIISNYIEDPQAVITGALGAVFGLASATVIVNQILITHQLLSPTRGNASGMFIFIGAYIGLTLLREGFDHSTFMGGMLTGFGLGFLLYKARPTDHQNLDSIISGEAKMMRVITTLMLTFFLGISLIISISPNVRTRISLVDNILLYSRMKVLSSYWNQGEMQRALPIIRTLTRDPAQDYAFYGHRADIELNTGDVDSAIDSLGKMLEGMTASQKRDSIPVDHFDLVNADLANMLAIKGNKDAALKALQPALERDAKAHTVEDSIRITEALLKIGERERAGDYLKKNIENYPDEKQLYSFELAINLRPASADRAAAMTLVEQCKKRESFKNRPWLLYLEGRIFEGFSEYLRAEELYLQAAELAQEKKMPYETIATPEFWYHRGICQSRLGNFKEAKPLLEKGLNLLQSAQEETGEEFQYLLELLHVYSRLPEQKELAGRRDAYTEKLAKFAHEGGSWSVHNQLAYYLAQVNHDLERALESGQRSVAMIRAAANLDTLAWVHYRKGNYDEALKLQQEALDKTLIDDPTSWYHLGAIHEGLANTTEAIQTYEKALEPGVDFFEINKCREALNKLKSK